MRNFLVVILVTLFFDASYAQTNYEKVDRVSSTVRASSVADLHSKLTTNLTSDEEKTRAFYFWIGHNIHYDVNESTRSFRTPFKQEPESVLKSGKAVCHGYSALFKELCDRSGIKCYLVSGFTRLNNKFDETGHTWNLIYLNNTWYQIDVTWAAGAVNEQYKFVKQFSDKYFLSSADDFFKEHYPFDPMWQLKYFPLDVTDYKKGVDTLNVAIAEEKFYFNDTILSWEKLDSTNRTLSAAQRMNAFNPDNAIIKQELNYAWLDCGNSEFEKGNLILNDLFPRTKSKQSTKSLIQPGSYLYISKLDSADICLKSAIMFYSKVDTRDSNTKVVVLNNIESAKYNLDIIKREKSRYKK